MFQYNFIIKKERRVRAWIGISLEDFRKLLPQYELSYKTYKENYRKNERIRAVGGGRKPELFDKASKLLFITLFYIRVYPTFDLLEGIFYLDKANIHHWVSLGMSLLEEILKEKIPLPAEKVSNFEELFKVVPDLKQHIPDAKRIADTAYADSTTDATWGIKTLTPMKKPPNSELTNEQKIFNKLLSSKRVRVEHVIAHLKYSRIFSDKIRYRKMSHDSIANIVGGLYNFKLGV